MQSKLTDHIWEVEELVSLLDSVMLNLNFTLNRVPYYVSELDVYFFFHSEYHQVIPSRMI